MIQLLSKANPRVLQGIALVRLDFNTEDDWRLKEAIPTLRFLKKHASKIIILSHRGRPNPVALTGKELIPFDAKYSLRHDAQVLGRLLGQKVHFVSHFDFKKIKTDSTLAPKGTIFVLENMRFLKGEAEGDAHLAKQFASLGDYFVNDAFAVSHRANASVAGIPRYLPSFAGFELEHELVAMGHLFQKPKRPMLLILGGGKAADKIGVIKNLKHTVDLFFLGGAIANTFLYLRGMDVLQSVRDQDPKSLHESKAMLKYNNIRLPVDFVWKHKRIVDVGKRTIKEVEREIARARTIFWNGPFGVFEQKPFDHATLMIARAIVRNKHAFTLAGGGETVTFLKSRKLDKKFSFISTGGGAMLEFLAGKKLPGIVALNHGKK